MLLVRKWSKRPAAVACALSLIAGLCLFTPRSVEAADAAVTVPVTLNELAVAGTVIADLSKNQADVPFQWSLIEGEPSLFDVDDRGVVRVAPGAALDFEITSTLHARLEGTASLAPDSARELFARDLGRSGLEAEAVAVALGQHRRVNLDVSLIDAPEPPVWSLDEAVVRFAPDRPLSEFRLQASDPDRGDVLRYEIVSGDPDGVLAFDGASGLVRVAEVDRQLGQFATQRLRLVVRATDSHGLFAERTLNVEVQTASPADAIALLQEPIRSEASSRPVLIIPQASTPAPVIAASSPKTAVVEQVAPLEAPVVVEQTRNVVAATTEPQPKPARPVSQPVAASVAAHVAPATAARHASSQAWGTGRIVAWALLAATFVFALSLRTARRRLGAAADPAADDETEAIQTESPVEAAPARRAGIAGQPAPAVRSLRAEMSNLLAVSQHFTRAERAHQQRRFHSRQFWLAAIATVGAGAIALSQSLSPFDRAPDRANLVMFGCLCVITAAAIRALMAIRSASEQIPATGPLGDDAGST